jgi:hypothetical protein
LSELLDAVEAERVQNELSEVRVLFELLGFLLRLSAFRYQLSSFRDAGLAWMWAFCEFLA